MTGHASQCPVLPGFFPDPSWCRVGGTVWLVSSSFEYGPGLPLHTSTDLTSWTPAGHVVTDPGTVDLSAVPPSNGLLAATLRHHDGLFWLATTKLADGGGHLVTHAVDPAGPWSAPVRFPGLAGIDPDLAWDDHGTCLLTWAGFGPHGSEGIVQAPVDPLTGAVLGERRHLWGGTGGQFPEGPHLYRHDGWWYLLIAEGGTERGHAVTLARSRRPDGGFEGFDGNPLLTRRGSDHPVQSTGHGDLLELADGSWAMAYHGTRPRGGSPGWHVLGRETYVDRVVWQDGWPRLSGHVAPAVDGPWTEHVAGGLPVTWVAASGYPAQVTTVRDGVLHVLADGGPEVFVGRRQRHDLLVATADLDVAGAGGLALRIDPWHQAWLERGDGHVRARVSVGDVATDLAVVPDTGLPLELRVEPADGPFWSVRLGPDTVRLGLRGADGFVELARLDGRALSTEVAGGMTGRMVGVLSGTATSPCDPCTWPAGTTSPPRPLWRAEP